MRPGAVDDIAAFAEALRGRGITVTPDQISDMARSLTFVDLTERDQVHAAMRSLSVTEPAQRGPFDEEFRRFFEWNDSPEGEALELTGHSRGISLSPVMKAASGTELDEAKGQAGASAVENLGSRDFADLDDAELAEARRMILSMFWQPSSVTTRRWAPDRRGSRPDLRRTLHGSVGPESDLVPVVMRRRRTRRRPLIVLTDVSGSMERYAEMFLVFAHAALQRLESVEVFTFSTRLTRISDDLRRRDARAALAAVTETVTDWSGGTKIGEAFSRWNRIWSRRMARGGPVALVLSDGWDCGEPRLLGDETARLSRSVHRLIWLNPLAGRPGFEPATRGMRTVLPHVDHLLPAATVNDLGDVVALLETLER